MKPAPKLRVVDETPEDEIASLLRRRDAASREIAAIDARMLGLRRRYADERGELMLPGLERLRRELLGD